MSMVQIGAALITAAGTYVAADSAANTSEEAIASAGAQSRIGARQQAQSTGQQLEISRPLVQTRDSALNALQTLFGLPQTAPTQLAATGSFGGTVGQRLIPLSGVASKEQVQGGRDIRQQTFYDPSTGRFVDESGAVLGMRPDGGGVVDGLTSGKNNSVRVDADGRLYSVGSGGENAITTLPGMPAQGEFVGGSATNPSSDRTTLIDTLMQTPGIRFVDEQGRKELEQMFAARGLRRSGAAFEAGVQRASDLASTNYTNLVLNPLFQLAGFGQQGANQAGGALAQQGQNATQNAGTLANLALQSGNARASSYQATGQAVGDLASNLAFIYERGRRPTDDKTGTVTASKPGFPPLQTGINPDAPLPANYFRDGLYNSVYGDN
jgi:hypothetical protein